MKKTIMLGIMALALAGCSSFRTVQTDQRIDAKTGEKTTVTTKASSFTFFDSKSSLAKWSAKQSPSSQGAEVGGLSQSSSATNVLSITGSAVEIGKLLAR